MTETAAGAIIIPDTAHRAAGARAGLPGPKGTAALETLYDIRDGVRISRLPSAADLGTTDILVVVQGTGNPTSPLETRQTSVEKLLAAVAIANPARVVSVAGKDGVVTLTTEDVGGLVAALNTLNEGKAPAIHRHTPPDIDGLAEFVAARIGEATNSPVLSVAGKTGNVVLATTDVGGLDLALANRSLVGHGHTAPEISGLEDIVLDGGSW